MWIHLLRISATFILFLRPLLTLIKYPLSWRCLDEMIYWSGLNDGVFIVVFIGLR
jgi:hypothetical protein